MGFYVRHKRNGEIRMDFHTFKSLPFNRVLGAMEGNRRLIRPRGAGKVREFK